MERKQIPLPVRPIVCQLPVMRVPARSHMVMYEPVTTGAKLDDPDLQMMEWRAWLGNPDNEQPMKLMRSISSKRHRAAASGGWFSALKGLLSADDMGTKSDGGESVSSMRMGSVMQTAGGWWSSQRKRHFKQARYSSLKRFKETGDKKNEEEEEELNNAPIIGDLHKPKVDYTEGFAMRKRHPGNPFIWTERRFRSDPPKEEQQPRESLYRRIWRMFTGYPVRRRTIPHQSTALMYFNADWDTKELLESGLERQVAQTAYENEGLSNPTYDCIRDRGSEGPKALNYPKKEKASVRFGPTSVLYEYVREEDPREEMLGSSSRWLLGRNGQPIERRPHAPYRAAISFEEDKRSALKQKGRQRQSSLIESEQVQRSTVRHGSDKLFSRLSQSGRVVGDGMRVHSRMIPSASSTVDDPTLIDTRMVGTRDVLYAEELGLRRKVPIEELKIKQLRMLLNELREKDTGHR